MFLVQFTIDSVWVTHLVLSNGKLSFLLKGFVGVIDGHCTIVSLLIEQFQCCP